MSTVPLDTSPETSHIAHRQPPRADLQRHRTSHIVNHRVQIFDSEGNYKRQFGTEGKEKDGQLFSPTCLVLDA
jgi:hypothetical protein